MKLQMIGSSWCKRLERILVANPTVPMDLPARLVLVLRSSSW
jgi:hypothetical protein